MKSFYLTDAGKVRNHNEDSVIIVKNRENVLWAFEWMLNNYDVSKKYVVQDFWYRLLRTDKE